MLLFQIVTGENKRIEKNIQNINALFEKLKELEQLFLGNNLFVSTGT